MTADWLRVVTLVSALIAPAASVAGGVANLLGSDDPGMLAYMLLPLSIAATVVMLGYVQIILACLVVFLRLPILRIIAALIAWVLAIDHAIYASVPHDLGHSVASASAPVVYPMRWAYLWLGGGIAFAIIDRIICGPRRKPDLNSPWRRPPGDNR